MLLKTNCSNLGNNRLLLSLLFFCVIMNIPDQCIALVYLRGLRAKKVADILNGLKSSTSKTGFNETTLYIEEGNGNTEQQGSTDRGFARTVDKVKLKKVCKLLQSALGTLEKLDSDHHNGVASKQEDKSQRSEPKPKSTPSLCFCSCGCRGCCLMRPIIMYRVKYKPPKFKMRALKAKTKCGNPLYGICLGRKKR